MHASPANVAQYGVQIYLQLGMFTARSHRICHGHEIIYAGGTCCTVYVRIVIGARAGEPKTSIYCGVRPQNSICGR